VSRSHSARPSSVPPENRRRRRTMTRHAPRDPV
jgi:hypothetical protein